MPTIRLTTAQALTRYLAARWIGTGQRLFAGPPQPDSLRGTIRRAVHGGDHLEYDMVIDVLTERLSVAGARVPTSLAAAAIVGIELAPSGLASPPMAAP